MKKLIPLLIAGVFSTGVFAQAVTTKPGEAMGPTGTNTNSTGASGSAGTPLKGDRARSGTPAATTRAGEAMGPTDGSAATSSGSKKNRSTSTTHRSQPKHKNNGSAAPAVTTNPGGAMGSTDTTTAGPKR